MLGSCGELILIYIRRQILQNGRYTTFSIKANEDENINPNLLNNLVRYISTNQAFHFSFNLTPHGIRHKVISLMFFAVRFTLYNTQGPLVVECYVKG